MNNDVRKGYVIKDVNTYVYACVYVCDCAMCLISLSEEFLVTNLKGIKMGDQRARAGEDGPGRGPPA